MDINLASGAYAFSDIQNNAFGESPVNNSWKRNRRALFKDASRTYSRQVVREPTPSQSKTARVLGNDELGNGARNVGDVIA